MNLFSDSPLSSSSSLSQLLSSASSNADDCSSFTRTLSSNLEKASLQKNKGKICRITNIASVADPVCLSRIPEPGFHPSWIQSPGSWIPDPKTAPKERDEKKLIIKLFFVAINFRKLKIILFLKC
jgi:hypothetical protein